MGFWARLMSSSNLDSLANQMYSDIRFLVPVTRAADDAKPGNGRVILDDNDPCLIIGHGTKFSSDFAPKWQILLPKSTGSLVAEVVESRDQAFNSPSQGREGLWMLCRIQHLYGR